MKSKASCIPLVAYNPIFANEFNIITPLLILLLTFKSHWVCQP